MINKPTPAQRVAHLLQRFAHLWVLSPLADGGRDWF